MHINENYNVGMASLLFLSSENEISFRSEFRVFHCCCTFMQWKSMRGVFHSTTAKQYGKQQQQQNRRYNRRRIHQHFTPSNELYCSYLFKFITKFPFFFYLSIFTKLIKFSWPYQPCWWPWQNAYGKTFAQCYYIDMSGNDGKRDNKIRDYDRVKGGGGEGSGKRVKRTEKRFTEWKRERELRMHMVNTKCIRYSVSFGWLNGFWCVSFECIRCFICVICAACITLIVIATCISAIKQAKSDGEKEKKTEIIKTSEKYKPNQTKTHK